MAQTAVEQLVNYMKENFHLTDEALQKFEEALQMEWEQLHKCASFWRGKECEIEKQIFERYYNETYNQNK